MTISSVQSSTHFQQVDRSAARSGNAGEKAGAVQGGHASTARRGAANYISATPGVVRGMDLGTLLPMRENVVVRGTAPGSQQAYADAVQATAEETQASFALHYSEAEYSLNP